MIPHITSVISKNPSMEFEMELLLRSIEINGKCKKYYCTIFSDEEITNSFLLKKAEIVLYQQKEDLKYPWWTVPRWETQAKGDVVIGMDSDVIVLKDMNKFMEETIEKNTIRGTIAVRCPFLKRNSKERWKELFNLCGLAPPKFEYKHKEDGNSCPFYINHGIVPIPVEFLERLRIATDEVVDRIKDFAQDSYFFPQIVTCLAIAMTKLPYEEMPIEYNTLRPEPPISYESVINENTVFYHYRKNQDINFESIRDFLEYHPKLRKFTNLGFAKELI